MVGAKYLVYKNDAHEMLFSVGANVELGGTGSSRVGAESGSTLSPAIFFGKGFGDLPDSAKYLRPLALTVAVSPNFSTHDFRAKSVDTGITLSYDLGYLQNYVKDAGLKSPFNRLIPIVELPLSTCTTGECGGRTTGTVNPGIIWYGRHYQLGLEATIPINRASGSHTGIILQLHLFIDDLFPRSLGNRSGDPRWAHVAMEILVLNSCAGGRCCRLVRQRLMPIPNKPPPAPARYSNRRLPRSRSALIPSWSRSSAG